MGQRLRQERERLQHNQDACAALGGVTRKTLFNYESGDSAPAGAFLIEIAKHGYDVCYILTGEATLGATYPSGNTSLESNLLAYYRHASPQERQMLERLADLGGRPAEEAKPAGKVKAKFKSLVGNSNVIGNGNSSVVTIHHGASEKATEVKRKPKRRST